MVHPQGDTFTGTAPVSEFLVACLQDVPSLGILWVRPVVATWVPVFFCLGCCLVALSGSRRKYFMPLKLFELSPELVSVHSFAIPVSTACA